MNVREAAQYLIGMHDRTDANERAVMARAFPGLAHAIEKLGQALEESRPRITLADAQMPQDGSGAPRPGVVQLPVQIPLHGDPMSDWRHMRIALSEAMANASCSNHSEALRAIYDALNQSVPDDLQPLREDRSGARDPGPAKVSPPTMTDDQRRLLESVRESNQPTPITGPGMLVSATALANVALGIATELEGLARKGDTPAIVAGYSAASLGWSRLAKALMSDPAPRKPRPLATGGPIKPSTVTLVGERSGRCPGCGSIRRTVYGGNCQPVAHDWHVAQ